MRRDRYSRLVAKRRARLTRASAAIRDGLLDSLALFARHPLPALAK